MVKAEKLERKQEYFTRMQVSRLGLRPAVTTGPWPDRAGQTHGRFADT
jgi:hypothetical protein